MTCGLVHASYSLPEWQVVQLTFFALWLHFHLPHVWNTLELLVLWKYILYKFIISTFAECFAWNWHSCHSVKGGQQYRVKYIFIYFVFYVLKYFYCSKGCKLKLNFSRQFETQCETCVHQWINYTLQEIQTQQNFGKQDA